MQRKYWIVVIAALAGIITLMPATTSGAAQLQTSDYGSPCHNWRNWTTGAENNPTMSPDVITTFRAGRHARCDRLVFELSGPAKVGYHAKYGRTVLEDGSTVEVAGPVDFTLVIRAWPKGWDTPKTSDDFAVKAGSVIYPASNPKGLRVVRAVKSGGAFEGQTTFAIGLNAKEQFRVFTTKIDPDRRVVIIEFAHQ